MRPLGGAPFYCYKHDKESNIMTDREENLALFKQSINEGLARKFEKMILETDDKSPENEETNDGE